MEVYWFEQTKADMLPSNDWLSASEAVTLEGLRFAKRRADWRLGRWTAKRALAAFLHLSADPAALAQIEIRAAPCGAPEVFRANRPAGVTISLSHREGIAACAIAASAEALGCDLEIVEARSEAFLADYFTREEQAWIARTPPSEQPALSALIWSAKESALKALREGLRLDTRSVTVTLSEPGELDTKDPFAPANTTFFDSRGDKHAALAQDDSDGEVRSSWRPLQVCGAGGEVFQGWWQHGGNVIRTLVATPPPLPPIHL